MTPVRKILILAANPKNTDRLRLDEEVREIKEGLQRSRNRDQFEIITRWAVRSYDLRRALLDYEPQIVHFSGHGAGAEGLALEDDSGQMKLVSGEALARLFKLFKAQVECVLLNACYSETQADAIHQHIDYVIGMSEAIGDRAAINFAVGFYDGLGANRSYCDAFELGLSAIDFEGLPEAAIPKLKQPSPNSSAPQPHYSSPLSVPTPVNSEPEPPFTEQMVQYNSNDVQAYQTIVQQGATAYIGNNQIHNYPEPTDSKGLKFQLISVTSEVERLASEVTNFTRLKLEDIRDLDHKGLVRSAQEQVQELRISENWKIFPETLQIEILKILTGYAIILDDDTVEASNLLQEALQINPKADLTFIQMLLVSRTRGIRASLEEFNNFNNINHINLKLALLLEINQAEEAISTIQTIPKSIQLNAETYRLHALALLMEGNILEAQLKINEAISEGPEWDTVREAEALINYHQSLSQSVLQKGRFPFPDPVDMAFIKHDDDSLHNLRMAETEFARLAFESERAEDLRQHWKVWQLACLANDLTRQDEAEDFCKALLEENPCNTKAILWAITRNYQIDISISKKNLHESLQVITDNREAIERITILLWLYLKDDKSQAALDLLNQKKEKFLEQGELNCSNHWHLLHIQALTSAGRRKEALQEVESLSDLQVRRYLTTNVLREIAIESGDWQAVIDHLENCFQETQDSKFLYECCYLKANLQDWIYVADRSEILLEKIGTPIVLTLAAECSYRANQPAQCLKLLRENPKLFQNSILPENLRRLKILCLKQTGAITTAAIEAESLIQEYPTANNLATLLAIQFQQGDTHGMVITARHLLEQDNVSQINLLQAARLVQPENLSLARQLWRKATEDSVEPEILGEVIDIGFKLSFDANDSEFRQYIHQAQLLAHEDNGPFKAIPLREIISLQRSWTEYASKLNSEYDRGQLPIHLVAKEGGFPIVNLYRDLLRKNAAAPNSHRQQPIFIRHGGRPVRVHPFSEEFELSCTRWRLHLDISAFLLADYLEILELLEKNFQPLKISALFQSALAHQRQMLQSHQPSQLELYRQVIDLLFRNVLKELPRQVDTSIPSNCDLVDKMGQQWVALLEKAKNEGGYLVDFLPLQTWINEEELRPVSLSPEAQAQVINCRCLLEALKQSKVITDNQYQEALIGLGSEKHSEPSALVPPLNVPIYLMGGTASVLAEAKILNKICQYFQVVVDYTYLDEARLAISVNEQRSRLVSELAVLIERVRDGLEKHTYETVTLPDSIASQELECENENNLSWLTAYDLFRFEPQRNDNLDIIWIDDRTLNQYLHRDGIQIITILEVLDALLAVGALNQDDYYDKLFQLRKANTRYIPITSEELVYWLKQAPIIDGSVRETEALAVLRQYIASCVLDTHRLQLPSISDNSRNSQGEETFLVSCLRATQAAMITGWLDDSVSNENAVSYASWVLLNIYLGTFGTRYLTPTNDSTSSGTDLLGRDISGLYLRGIQLWQEQDSKYLEEKSLRQDYFTWLDWQLTDRRFKVDPEVLATTAKDIYFWVSEQSKAHKDDELQDQVIRYIHQQFYYDLPSSLCAEINSDQELMDWLGIKTIPSIRINTLSLPAAEFWQATEAAINGKEATITALEPEIELRIQPTTNNSTREILEIRSKDDSIVQGIDDALFQVLHHDPSRIAEVLQSRRFWLDFDNETLDKIIAEITSIQEPLERFKQVKVWREQSLAFFYKKLKLELADTDEFSISKLMPPFAEGFLRHFRIDVEISSCDAFHTHLRQVAQSLIAEEGLEEALERLACLPVKLPAAILEELNELSPQNRQTLLKQCADSWASPIYKFHLIDLALCFPQDEEGELVKHLLDEVFSDTATPHFHLLSILLQLTDNSFSLRPDVKEWSVPVRLAMTWAHASKLQNFLDIPGIKLQEFIENLWGPVQSQVNPDRLNRNSEFWNDVLHPHRFDPIVVAVHGLASLLQDKPLDVLRQTGVIERIQAFAVQTLEEHCVPKPQLFRDPMLAQDSLKSILGGDRGHCLAPFLGSELAQYLESASLRTIIEGTIQNLESDPTDLNQWSLLSAVVGDLPIYEDLKGPLKQVVVQSNIATWFKMNPELGLLSLDVASAQVNYIGDEKVRAQLENQLLSLIRNLAEDAKENVKEDVSAQLIETIFRLSIKPSNPCETSQHAADLMISAVNTCQKLADTHIYTGLFKLIQELPTEQLHGFWKAFLHLRTLRSQQIN